MPLKQVLLLRADLDVSQGKMIAQACHASLGAYKKSESGPREDWERQGQKKIVLWVKGEEEIFDRIERAKGIGISCQLVKDAGKTELSPATVTAAGLGPAQDESLDKVTGDLSTKR